MERQEQGRLVKRSETEFPTQALESVLPSTVRNVDEGDT